MLAVNHLWFWCHKVIPLVYDDSLSYYELLCKVVQKVNEIISNMSELDEYIKEEISHAFEDTDAVRNIIDQILADNNIALRSDLTSNDIDINTAYTLYYAKAENFKTLQCFVHLDAGGYLAVFGKYDRQHYAIRQMTDEWQQIGSTSGQFVGHGNDCAFNGNDILYVLSSWTDDNDVQHDSGRIRAIRYPEMTEDVTKSFTVTYGGSAIRIDTFCYDRENHLFYCIDDNEVYVINDDTDHTVVKKFTMKGEVYTDYHDQYPRMAQQGSTFYNGMIVRFYAYPNMIAFYDVKKEELVKVYTIPYKSEIGNALTELECGCFNGDNLFVSAFQRDHDGGLSTDTTSGAWSTILKINFWTNVPKGYQQKANEYSNYRVYVDGSTTNNKHYGTLTYPYRTLSEAMSTLHSPIATEQPVDILCRVGTKVGVLRGESYPAFRISEYKLTNEGDTATKFEINGIDLSYTDCQIYNAVIHRNDSIRSSAVEFPNTAKIRFGSVYFGYCTFDAPYDNTAYCLRNDSAEITLRQNTFTSVSGGYCLYCGNEGSIVEDGNTFNGAVIKLDAGMLYNRSGKVSAITSKIAGGALIPTNRVIIFDGTAKAVGEYDIDPNVALSEYALKRNAIITLAHNTGYTECYCTLIGTDAPFFPSAITVTLAGVAQIHSLNCRLHFDTNKLEITQNRTVKVSDGTVYTEGTSASGIQYATITRIELV